MVKIIAGDWGPDNQRPSSVATKIYDEFVGMGEEALIFNGGLLSEMPAIKPTHLTLWMPNISNECAKQYPVKALGTCLIVSKVVRPVDGQHKFTEAVARIFKMNGNAVIAIENKDGRFKFNLIDALGNIWVSTMDIKKLCMTIVEFYRWHKAQQRISMPRSRESLENTLLIVPPECPYFMVRVQNNAKAIMNNSGTRYFGNCSTRCQQTFPSLRSANDMFLFSPRNSDKTELSMSDMVLVLEGRYVGERKPSVDTPVQLRLYQELPNINFMIHGHAFIEDTVSTDHYYACGDIRECQAVLDKIDKDCTSFKINLKGHGYLIGAANLLELDKLLLEVPVMRPFRSINSI